MKKDIILAGVGGQGILTIATVIGTAALIEGLQLKQAEVHGMSQRGGSVTCDVRFGEAVLSPMVPAGQTDYLVVLAESQTEAVRHLGGERSILLSEKLIRKEELPNVKALNVAMLGVLSVYLAIPEQVWLDAVKSAFSPSLHQANIAAFALGRTVGNTEKTV